MTVSFIFIGIAISFILLIIAFLMKDYTIGMLSGFTICALGVYISIYDIEGLNNLLTDALGLILLSLGAYIFLNLGKEKIEELM